jgi:hypothetical protein
LAAPGDALPTRPVAREITPISLQDRNRPALGFAARTEDRRPAFTPNTDARPSEYGLSAPSTAEGADANRYFNTKQARGPSRIRPKECSVQASALREIQF